MGQALEPLASFGYRASPVTRFYEREGSFVYHHANLLRQPHTTRSARVRGGTGPSTPISMNKKEVVYITTPIYYVNDQPHIGHAYTTIAADVLARYHRLRGRDVFFMTGTDEHGAKVEEAATKAGVTPKEFADRTSAQFRTAFDALAITYDKFIRTTDSEHERQVLVFMQKLKDAGALEAGEYVGLYCTGCEEFKTEKDLIYDQCPVHRQPVEHIKEKNWFFKLHDYIQSVQSLIESGKLHIVPAARREEVLGLFKQELANFSVSREKVKWGIPFPGEDGQTIYVWVEALQNYITGIGYSDDRATFTKYWPHATHFIGKDILKFHAVYWPAMLLAASEEPPKRIIVNGYFQLNGQKMSKSLGNVIAPADMIKQFGVDGTRYLLLSQFPYGEDGNIQADKFVEKYNADLANGIGNLASRVLAMAHKFSGGEMPDYDYIAEDFVLHAKALALQKTVEQELGNGAFFEALRQIWALIKASDDYIQKEQPWKLAKEDPEKLKHVLADLLLTLQELAVLLAPFLPQAAQKLADALAMEELTSFDQARVLLPPGRAFIAVEALFPRKE